MEVFFLPRKYVPRLLFACSINFKYPVTFLWQRVAVLGLNFSSVLDTK